MCARPCFYSDSLLAVPGILRRVVWESRRWDPGLCIGTNPAPPSMLPDRGSSLGCWRTVRLLWFVFKGVLALKEGVC